MARLQQIHFGERDSQTLEILAKNAGNMAGAAKEMGLSGQAIAARLDTILRRSGIETVVSQYPVLREVAAKRLERALERGDPKFENKWEALKNSDAVQALPRRLLERLEQRVSKSIPDPETLPEGSTDDDILKVVQERFALTLGYIDRVNLATASLSELQNTLKALFDISQVLQGKPTSITQTKNLNAIKDLLPAILREAERRGIKATPPLADPSPAGLLGSHPPP